MRYVICLVALISFFTNASESDPISNPEVELVKQCILGELLSGNDERTIGQIKTKTVPNQIAILILVSLINAWLANTIAKIIVM